MTFSMKIALTTEECYLRQVLGLQDKYHVDNVGKQKRGFLTFRANGMTEMSEIANDLGVIVVLNGETVVGYDILMSYRKASQLPLYKNAIKVYTDAYPSVNSSSIGISAQYCIAESHRGGRNVKRMFEVEWETMRRRGCAVSIGEVDSSNTISLACVTRLLRYRIVGEYKTDETKWVVFERML